MSDKMVDAVVIEANGIEQTGGRFHRSRRRVPDAGLPGHGLGNNAAEAGRNRRSSPFPSHSQRFRKQPESGCEGVTFRE